MAHIASSSEGREGRAANLFLRWARLAKPRELRPHRSLVRCASCKGEQGRRSGFLRLSTLIEGAELDPVRRLVFVLDTVSVRVLETVVLSWEELVPQPLKEQSRVVGCLERR